MISTWKLKMLLANGKISLATPRNENYHYVAKKLFSCFLKAALWKVNLPIFFISEKNMKINFSHEQDTPGWWSYQPQISKDAKNISAEAPGNLYNAWKLMGKFLASSAISVSQLFVYKTPFDLWLRNRWRHRKPTLAKT